MTEVLSPPILVATILLVVAWHASETLAQAMKWGLIAAAAASFLPLFYIIRGVRRGRWTDKHVVVLSDAVDDDDGVVERVDVVWV